MKQTFSDTTITTATTTTRRQQNTTAQMGRGGKFDAKEALDQLKKHGMPGNSAIARRIGLGAAAVGSLFMAYNSLYTVQGGYKAVKFNCITGLSEESYGAGTHFRVPLLETVTHFDIRQQPISIQSSQGSRDLQIVNTSVRVLYKANEQNLPTLYRRLGMQYADVVLPSISNEVLKAVIVCVCISSSLSL